MNHIEHFVVWFSRYSKIQLLFFFGFSANFSQFFEVLGNILDGTRLSYIL